MGCSRLSNVHARQRGYIFNRMASPVLKEKQQPANGIPHKLAGGIYAAPYRAYVNYIRRAGCPHPAASSRNHPSTGSHPRRGRRPRRPGNLPSPPIPGETSGPGMPGPYRAAVGKPPAVRKRPWRGQDPSLRTAPSTSACTPPRGGAGTATKKPRRSLFQGLPRFFI